MHLPTAAQAWALGDLLVFLKLDPSMWMPEEASMLQQ